MKLILTILLLSLVNSYSQISLNVEGNWKIKAFSSNDNIIYIKIFPKTPPLPPEIKLPLRPTICLDIIKESDNIWTFKADKSKPAFSTNTIEYYYWYFDGKKSSGKNLDNITHEFTIKGDHSIRLAIQESNGRQSSINKTIKVE